MPAEASLTRHLPPPEVVNAQKAPDIPHSSCLTCLTCLTFPVCEPEEQNYREVDEQLQQAQLLLEEHVLAMPSMLKLFHAIFKAIEHVINVVQEGRAADGLRTGTAAARDHLGPPQATVKAKDHAIQFHHMGPVMHNRWGAFRRGGFLANRLAASVCWSCNLFIWSENVRRM